MNNISNSEDLKNIILKLENDQILKANLVKEQFLLIHESIRPINIIKSTLAELISSPEIKTSLAEMTIGMTVGSIAKNVVVGKSHNILKQFIGGMLQMVVAKEVTKNADGIIDMGKNLFNKMLKSRN